MSLVHPLRKVPFWSAIIPQTQGTVSAASVTWTYVDIQPPVGETWWIRLNQYGYASSGYQIYMLYYDYDGTTRREHAGRNRVPATNPAYGHYFEHDYMGYDKIITNTLYASLTWYQNTGATQTYGYGYSGFKLSQPLWTPKRLNDPPAQPWKKPTSLSLPSAIAPLQKYAADILGIDPAKPNEYALGIILEEDTPLAIDEKTGFPVERLTVVVKADVLADFIAKFKAKTADPVATGYARYIKKWLDEGIDLGVRV
jgi:hypothetical protein